MGGVVCRNGCPMPVLLTRAPVLSRPHTARFYLRLSTMCHRGIKVNSVKNRSTEYRIIKPLTLCDLLQDFIMELLELTCHKSKTKPTDSVQSTVTFFHTDTLCLKS